MSLVAIELATAYVSIIPDTSKIAPAVKKGMSGVDREASAAGDRAGKGFTGKFGTLISKAGPLIGVAFGAAIVGGVKSAIGNASELEQTLGGVDAVFGKSADRVVADSDRAAKALGLSKIEYQKLITVAGASLKNKGIKDFTGEATNLLNVGADLAAQYGGSTSDAVAALNSLMRGETDPIEKYGISINAAAVEAELLASGAQKVNGQWTEQQKTQARLNLVMEQSADAQGAFNREQDTMAGRQAIMAASLDNLKTKFGTALLPAISSVVGVVSDFVTEMDTGEGAGGKFAEVVGKISDKVGDAVGWISDKVKVFVTDFQNGEGAAGKLRDVLETVFNFIRDDAIPAAEDLVGWLKDNEETVKLITTALLGAVAAYKTYTVVMAAMTAAKKIATIAQKAWNAAMKANPIGIIVTAIGLLVGALIYLYNNNETVKNAIDKAWAVIKTAIDAVVKWFKDTAWPWMRDALGWIGDKVTWLWNTIIKPYFDFILGIWKSVFGWIKDKGWPWVRDALSSIGNAASNVWTNYIKPAFDKIKSGVEAVVKAFQSAKDGIGNAWSTLKDKVSGPIRDALSWINKNFIDPLNSLLGKVGISFRVPRINVSGSGAKGVASSGGSSRAFATGGVLPGFSPGKDNMHFYSPTHGGLSLSGGEAIMRPEWTRALGKGTIDAWNAAARSGGVNGVRKAMGFAGGGIIPWIKKKGSDAIDLVSSIGKVLADPKGALADFAKRILGTAANNPFAQALIGVGQKIASGVADKVLNFGGDGVSGGPGGAMHWKAIWSLIKAVAPEARKTSDFRPGAVTATGLPSKHGAGRAVDIVSSNMMATFNKIKPLRPWTELIYSPAGARQMYNGRNFNGWSPVTRRMHYDHIHAAMARGGVLDKPFVADSGVTLAPGINVVHNKLGKPEPLARTDQMPRGDIHVHLEVDDLRAIKTVEEFVAMVDVRSRMQAGVRR